MLHLHLLAIFCVHGTPEFPSQEKGNSACLSLRVRVCYFWEAGTELETMSLSVYTYVCKVWEETWARNRKGVIQEMGQGARAEGHNIMVMYPEESGLSKPDLSSLSVLWRPQKTCVVRLVG